MRKTMKVLIVALMAVFTLGSMAEAAGAKKVVKHRTRHSSRVASSTGSSSSTTRKTTRKHTKKHAAGAKSTVKKHTSTKPR